MYVMFPAEDIIQISLGVASNQIANCNHQPIAAPVTYVGANAAPSINHHPPSTERHLFQTKSKSATAKRGIRRRSGGKTSSANTMASAPGHQETSVLKEAYHPSLNESLKAHNSVSFKLVKTVSEFTQQLGQIYEQHSEELQTLVSNYRKRNGELRKERPACPSAMFHTWEVLLQEVEIDSQTHSDIASILSRQVSRPLLERTFHRKLQSRKVFANRESYEALLKKTEEKLSKCRQDYKAAYALYASQQTQQNLAAYMDAHNAYVTQLHATNGMLDQYNRDSLPGLLKELEDVYTDLCMTLTESVLQGAEIISARAVEQAKRYDGLGAQCKGVTPELDLVSYVKCLTIPSQNPHRLYNYAPAQVHHQHSTSDQPNADANVHEPSAPLFKDELLIERPASIAVKPKLDALKKEALELETEIKQLHDALETLLRIQQRSVESSLYNKVNEIQEDISMKRFDLKVAQIHLGAIRAQKELFSSKIDSVEGRERKMSSSSTGSMKNKWLKAFKSLKTPQSNGQPSKEQEKKNGGGQLTPGGGTGGILDHNFQEYTYKKITPCDVCSQVLRGHTRQGLKCRHCKLNVHVDCQNDVQERCQPKSRLLRRQKSTSELDTSRTSAAAIATSHADVPSGVDGEDKASEVDAIYQVLKQAGEMSSTRKPTTGTGVLEIGGRCTGGGGGGATSSSTSRSMAPPLHLRPQPPTSGTSSLAVTQVPLASSSAPHTPRRQKLNLRMKSLSLDSPESSDPHRHQQRVPTAGSHLASANRLQSPSSPVHNRRLLCARNMRMSSVELPDDNDRSLSSASTSPCPSPKPHRLLPTNLYVVLYNFKSRQQDEMDLKAGYKVTVVDTSDADWWKGKCLGRTGFFPSKYVTKLQPGERPLQVTHNLQVSDGDNGLMLLRDQIVIQVGDELDGMVMIRAGDTNKQGVCPLKFLQEV